MRWFQRFSMLFTSGMIVLGLAVIAAVFGKAAVIERKAAALSEAVVIASGEVDRFYASKDEKGWEAAADEFRSIQKNRKSEELLVIKHLETISDPSAECLRAVVQIIYQDEVIYEVIAEKSLCCGGSSE